jgi:hypothetical protein
VKVDTSLSGKWFWYTETKYSLELVWEMEESSGWKRIEGDFWKF